MPRKVSPRLLSGGAGLISRLGAGSAAGPGRQGGPWSRRVLNGLPHHAAPGSRNVPCGYRRRQAPKLAGGLAVEQENRLKILGGSGAGRSARRLPSERSSAAPLSGSVDLWAGGCRPVRRRAAVVIVGVRLPSQSSEGRACTAPLAKVSQPTNTGQVDPRRPLVSGCRPAGSGPDAERRGEGSRHPSWARIRQRLLSAAVDDRQAASAGRRQRVVAR